MYALLIPIYIVLHVAIKLSMCNLSVIYYKFGLNWITLAIKSIDNSTWYTVGYTLLFIIGHYETTCYIRMYAASE